MGRGAGTGNALLTNIAYDVAVSPRRTYGGTAVKFAVGYKLNGKTGHAIVEAEDALIAALKVKARHPEARVTYVRPSNRRGDTRHPPLQRLGEERA